MKIHKGMLSGEAPIFIRGGAAVKKVLSVLKECNIRNVLFYLTEGLPEKRYEKCW